jgi:hypothetical protein
VSCADCKDAPIVAHPECTYAVRMLADEIVRLKRWAATVAIRQRVHGRDAVRMPRLLFSA